GPVQIRAPGGALDLDRADLSAREHFESERHDALGAFASRALRVMGSGLVTTQWARERGDALAGTARHAGADAGARPRARNLGRGEEQPARARVAGYRQRAAGHAGRGQVA